MHTQMEVIRGEKLYQTYKDKKIVFSNNVSRFMGLKQKDTRVKIGMERTRGAVVSATMDEILLIAYLDESLQKKSILLRGWLQSILTFMTPCTKRRCLLIYSRN